MSDFPAIVFDSAAIRVQNLFKDEAALAEIRKSSPDAVPQKVREVYGEVCFPPAGEERPYTYASIVLSADGKMAYPDCPQGPVIASSNKLDADCGKADFWVLNMLRMYADAVIMGARTLQTEADVTAHVFDPDLAQARVNLLKKPLYPLHVAVSLDGTDVPLAHRVFAGGGLPCLIATSAAGSAYLAKAFAGQGRACRLYGPFPLAAKASAELICRGLKEDPDAVHVLSTGAGAVPDSAVLLALLRRMGIQRAMVESPSYMWHLQRQKSLDEFFINYSMLFAGGDITLGLRQPFTAGAHPHSELLMLGIHKQNLICTRQRLHYEFM